MKEDCVHCAGTIQEHTSAVLASDTFTLYRTLTLTLPCIWSRSALRVNYSSTWELEAKQPTSTAATSMPSSATCHLMVNYNYTGLCDGVNCMVDVSLDLQNWIHKNNSHKIRVHFFSYFSMLSETVFKIEYIEQLLNYSSLHLVQIGRQGSAWDLRQNWLQEKERCGGVVRSQLTPQGAL